jgi:phage FluMu protein Com
MICPQCRSVDCFRSHRYGADHLFGVFGLRPWRCHTCDKRFYAARVALCFSAYAHCPKCGNLDLEHISGERVEKGTLVAVKRWLRFPAYRCDPCRQRFFSVLPFRRILPSTISSKLRRVSGSAG